MTKEEIKKDLGTLIDCDTVICISENGFGIHGSTPDLLTLYTRLTKEMLELRGANKEILEKAFEMAFMDKEELLDLLATSMSEVLNDYLDKKKKKEEKEDKSTE